MDLNGEWIPAQEGLFDAQLSFLEAPQPITRLVKRDGRIETFDKGKIANAIFAAAQSMGGTDRDRALSLASGVSLYLSKKLRGETPTSDQVGDAVEKVLIEMGHARTALAYARFRDRRGRVRRLQRGDTRDILNELAEARREAEMGPTATSSLFVRTSSERLVSWDRAKIVEALVRETGLDEGMANLIAIGVEQQIDAAGVKTLTAALVRELVNAKLMEHGLERYWRRHVRLGVPLYDADRIIRGGKTDGRLVDPETTNRVLAESVKHEYALAEVFSMAAADAHLRGDLYIHGLSHVDRLETAVHSIGSAVRFGVGHPDSGLHSRPPRHADTLLGQMVNLTDTLHNHFSGAVGWSSVNVHFAPFTEHMDDRDLHQMAQMLIYEYAYRAITREGRAAQTHIGLCWQPPEWMRSAGAAGPGGEILERNYGEFAHAAQRLAWALLDVVKEGGAGGSRFPGPTLVMEIAPGDFKAQGFDIFLEHAAETAARRGHMRFLFLHDDRTEGIHPWQPQDAVVQTITLNLPRLAYCGGTEENVERELAGLIEKAAYAHADKRTFIGKLYARKSLGPLGLLAVDRDGPYLDLHEAQYVLGLTGLNECVRALTNRHLHESDEAMALAVRLTQTVARLCRELGRRLDMRLVPGLTTERSVSRRFAMLDLEAFPLKARNVVATDSATNEILYTPGGQLATGAGFSPFERARLQGHLQASAGTSGGVSMVHVSDTDISGQAIADLVKKAYQDTRIGGIDIKYQ